MFQQENMKQEECNSTDCLRNDIGKLVMSFFLLQTKIYPLVQAEEVNLKHLVTCEQLLPEWLSSVWGSRPFSGGVISSQMKLLMFSSPR